jgi:uncharacterized protein (UPF0261 family)
MNLLMTSILLIGTCDTKAAEILFMKSSIESAGARVVIMDVGTGTSALDPPAGIVNEDVAKAGGYTLEELLQSGDEKIAMTRMAAGAAVVTNRLYGEGTVQGFIALGGTMGTDLALDAASALPVGVPKLIVSTIAFSHLVPPHRVPADLMMILWAGGLYGLNSICETVLSQASAAIVGAARASVKPPARRPLIGITSLGKSCLQYMAFLIPELEARGYEAAVFHSTGMGGRAFESMAAQGRFAAVLDLCLQEVANQLGGSVVTAGESRLESAGRAGIPQIVAPGATDMLDYQAWEEPPVRYRDRPFHAHNRLLASVTIPPEDRGEVARLIGKKLAASHGRVKFILPLQGVQEWDRPGQSLYDPEGLQEFIREARRSIRPPVELVEIDAHINDRAFADRVLAVFDEWIAQGVVPAGVR